ncbi:MAG: argininosuccinate lyase, partial [Candidatus Caldatribacteriota bacterium]
KEPLFDSVDILKKSILIMTGMISTMQVKSDNMKKSISGDFSNATELADYLVKKGLPFRDAHRVVGEIVLYCIDKKKSIEQLNLEELHGFQSTFQKDVLTILSPEDVVNSKISYGGTSIQAVKCAIKEAVRLLEY